MYLAKLIASLLRAVLYHPLIALTDDDTIVNTVAVLVAPCARRWTMSTCSSEDCSNRPGSLRRFTSGYRTSMLRAPLFLPWYLDRDCGHL